MFHNITASCFNDTFAKVKTSPVSWLSVDVRLLKHKFHHFNISTAKNKNKNIFDVQCQIHLSRVLSKRNRDLLGFTVHDGWVVVFCVGKSINACIAWLQIENLERRMSWRPGLFFCKSLTPTFNLWKKHRTHIQFATQFIRCLLILEPTFQTKQW